MFSLGRHELIVGLGSSAPDAAHQLRRARAALRAQPGLELVRHSAFYASDAMLPPDAPRDWDHPYLNAALRLRWTGPEALSAAGFVALLKKAERELGRVEAPRWAPRLIDLDLLAWGGPDVAEPGVAVPHPGLLERPFALLPALDVAPEGARLGEAASQAARWRYSHPEDVPLRTRRSTEAWPELVAVLNLTPDSFSDGAPALPAAELEARIERLVRDGASCIDVGAESTRPGATPVAPEAEIERLGSALEPLLAARKRLGFRLSLDSRHAKTVAWALERLRPDWVNDVEGFSAPEMAALAARSSCRLVVMHSLGVPPSRDRTLDPLRDPVAQLLEWGRERVAALAARGIARDRVVFDPGIGFGKTAAQNMALAERAGEFHALGTAVLIGHSRKRFLDPEDKVPANERDLETALVTARLAATGADYLRVHDPLGQARALRLAARMNPPAGP